MPKTTKKPVKKSLISRINPRSGKQQVLLFALVFAAVGGSYAAYKSFAASPITHLYNQIVNENTATPATDQVIKGKSNTQVWRLPYNGTSVYTKFVVNTSSPTSYTPCITVKRPASAVTMGDVEIVFGNEKLTKGSTSSYSFEPFDQYVSYCAKGYIPVSGSSVIGVRVKNMSGGDLYLASIYLGSK